LWLTPLSDPPTAKIIAGDGRMRVTVKLFGPLLERLPSEKRRMPLELEVPDGATVNDVAEMLGLGDVGAVILINDQEGHRGKRLSDGDVVSFFPPLAGGV
jgi:molybdopterin converting factor small subunit